MNKIFLFLLICFGLIYNAKTMQAPTPIHLHRAALRPYFIPTMTRREFYPLPPKPVASLRAQTLKAVAKLVAQKKITLEEAKKQIPHDLHEELEKMVDDLR